MNQLSFSSLPATSKDASKYVTGHIGKNMAVYFLIFLMGYGLISLTADYISEEFSILAIVIFSLAIGYIVVGYIYNFIVTPKKRREIDNAFASFLNSNGFAATDIPSTDFEYAPFIYGLGTRTSTGMGFEGNLGGTPFKTYIYSYHKESKNRESSYHFTVFRFSLSKPLPHIVLDSRKNDGIVSGIPRFFSDDQRIELEGDFNNYFDLFAPRDYEIEALDILSPDFMQMLIDFHSDFDVEINQTEVYLISKGVKYDQQSMAELFKAAEVLIEKFNHKLQVWSMAAMAKNLPELDSYVDESAIRLGGKRISTAIFTIPLLSLYITARVSGAGFNIWVFAIIFVLCIAGFSFFRRYRRERN